MNRRDFLKRAGAVAIVPAAVPGGFWGPKPVASSAAPEREASQVRPSITAVVYDERYTDCTRFAAALIRQGAVGFPAHGDSAQLWYGLLGAHVAQHSGWVAGLTTYADFSVSQACGREMNLAALYEGAHDGRRLKTNLKHRIRATGDLSEILDAFSRSDVPWPESLANALSRVPESRSVAIRNLATATTPRSADHPGYLASWLLVPRSLA
ncbi:MAG TPA: twin-arginine translocation signal domain-containing protein [Candidatus Acidoferrales bacterium]